MRSHAKAPSAASSTHWAHGRDRIVRGAGATRGLSHNADGSSASAPSRQGRIAALSLVSALLSLALFASSAFASKQVISDFGTAAGSGSFGGELNNPRDVAANGTGVGPANAGDVYVADEANNRIGRFAANGTFVSAWGKDVIAASINERQRMVVKATTNGTFTLTFNGSTTEPIPYTTFFNTNPVEVRNALAALPSVGGSSNVEVSGSGTTGEPLIVTFQGTLGGADQPTLTADASQLNGTVSISTIVNGAPTVADDTGTGFEVCTVATECKAGGASGENGALDQPQSVALDPDTGNLYVSDRGNRRIDEYDGAGAFIRSFGFDVAESGPGNTGTGYEVCDQAGGDVCKAGVGGSGVGQYGEGFAFTGFGIAVSPADGSASTGTVYLANSGNQRVETFDIDGTSPANFGSSSNFGSEQPRSVAVDSRGIVYASDSNKGGDIQRYDSLNANGGGVGFLAPIVPPGNEVQEVSFSGFAFGDHFRLTCPNGEPTPELTYTSGEGVGRKVIQQGLEDACGAGSVSAFGEPPNTTVVFRGAFGGADQPQMTCTKLSGAGSCSVSTTSDGYGGPLLTGNDSTATAGLAVDPDSDGAGPDVDVLYVLRAPFGATVVQQFGSTTSPPGHAPGLTSAPSAVDDTHGTTFGFSSVQGFGLDHASGRLFVSSTNDPDGGGNSGGPIIEAHRVYVLADASSLADPTASMKPITIKASRTATFEAGVDPKGGLVSCKFQYSTDGASWTDVKPLVPDCPYLDPNGGTQDVNQNVSGLSPNTGYSVRLQVTRPYFTTFTPVTSDSQSLSTDTEAPLLTGATAQTLDDSSVRVSASIDPSHSPTTYVIQYGTSEALGSSTTPVDVGGGTQAVQVSPVISGLVPATEYFFKLVATNEVGSTPSGVLTATTFTTPPSFGACANDRFRTGPSAKLPDCRAYELATPVDKFGSDVSGSDFSVEASPSGDGITFFTLANYPGGDGFQNIGVFLSRFADGEWSTRGLLPPPSYGEFANVESWTPDLNLTFSRAFKAYQEGGNGANIVMRDSSDGSHTVLIPQVVESPPSFRLDGAFDDDSKVVFEAYGRATSVTSGPAPEGESANLYLYDRDTGEQTVIGLLPDSACGNPPCLPVGEVEVPAAYGSFIQDGHAVSSGGDVYFVDTADHQLYLRRDAAGPEASTMVVSASEASVPDPNGTFPAIFQGATPDGVHAFFSSEQELTNDASTAAGTQDLYRFDRKAQAGNRLTDVAPGAEVVGLAGYSDEGDYVYFVANADLDAGGPAAAGNCEGLGERSSGSCSLYLWRAEGAGGCASATGCITFVAPQEGGEFESEGQNWGVKFGSEMKTSRVSTDGRVLVFRSAFKLSDVDDEEGSRDFYRYDTDNGRFTCLTCDPTGHGGGGGSLANGTLEHSNTSSFSYGAQPFLTRNLSPDGKRFFFQTANKLVPADVNGDQECPVSDPSLGRGGACRDVYEWEAPGKGSCTLTSGAYSPVNEGCLYLLSAGTDAYPSSIADTSESGDTVFIFSRDQLVPSDQDAQLDIYAAKVDGGLASQHAVRPAACEGDACRGASSHAPDSTGAGSAVFEGPGNPKANVNATRCPKGKRHVRSKGKVRCVKRQAKKHHHKTQKRHQSRANDNRRASR